MPQSMRALVAGKVGEPTDVLRLESRPVPTPKAGQALIRVTATPIHASDLHVLRGRYGFSPEFPTVGGHMECVGRIEALGPDTEGLKTGERVVAVAVPAAVSRAAWVRRDPRHWLQEERWGSTARSLPIGRLTRQRGRARCRHARLSTRPKQSVASG